MPPVIVFTPKLIVEPMQHFNAHDKMKNVIVMLVLSSREILIDNLLLNFIHPYPTGYF